jgi:hypothetical protein
MECEVRKKSFDSSDLWNYFDFLMNEAERAPVSPFMLAKFSGNSKKTCKKLNKKRAFSPVL